MTQVNEIDLTLVFKPETDETKADELKHILEYLPDLYQELARQAVVEIEE